MTISNSARSITIPSQPHHLPPLFTNRRWWMTGALLSLFAIVFFFRQADPLTDLATAKARWEAAGITDYRIVVTFERPFSTCQQDFDVRGNNIDYKHKDSCSVGGAITQKPGLVYPTVDNLFTRVEDALNTPQCGPNGCVCDGPIEITALYDANYGYPLEIVYTLRTDLRTRDLQYWLALLDGSLANCPVITYAGQTIRVASLEPLEPFVGQLAEATKEPLLNDGANEKPKTRPD